MRKFFGYILSPFVIIAFFLVLLIFQPIQWVCYKFFGYAAHKRSVDILNLCLLRTVYLAGNTVVFINKQNLPIGRPIIFLANHQSLFDIPALIYYLRKYHAKFISKIELTKGIPSISYNLKYGGGANIDRNDSRQSITEIVKLANRMKENKWSAVIFPEGTRSKDGQMKSFQVGGIATILKKCPEALIVPIAINGTWKITRYGYYPLDTFERMTWEVLQPIEPNGRPHEDVVKEAEDRIRASLKSEVLSPKS
jgi:1-acyl-sn-glycerol-3-phosphate acyltransferase